MGLMDVATPNSRSACLLPRPQPMGQRKSSCSLNGSRKTKLFSPTQRPALCEIVTVALRGEIKILSHVQFKGQVPRLGRERGFKGEGGVGGSQLYEFKEDLGMTEVMDLTQLNDGKAQVCHLKTRAKAARIFWLVLCFQNLRLGTYLGTSEQVS